MRAAGTEVSCCALVLCPLPRNCSLECASSCLEVFGNWNVLFLQYFVPAVSDAGDTCSTNDKGLEMLREATLNDTHSMYDRVARTAPRGTIGCHHPCMSQVSTTL